MIREGLGAPTAWAALEYMTMVQQSIEHGAYGGHIAQQLTPVIHRAIRS